MFDIVPTPTRSRDRAFRCALTLGLLLAARPAAAQVDLVLNMSDSPDPIPAGGVVTYAITVENDGSTMATGVALAFDLPGGTTYEGFTSAAASCGGIPVGQVGPATLSCTLPDLAPSAVVGVDIDLRTSSSGNFTVDARSTANEPDGQASNNDAAEVTTVVAGADVGISITGPATVASGDFVTYTLDLTNGGPDPASELRVQFPVPSGFVPTGGLPGGCSLSGSTITCSVAGPIASGSGASVGSFTGQISAASGSTLAASASVQVATSAPPGTPRDPDAANNVDVANTSVTAGSDVRIAKSRSAGGPYFVGSGFSFVLSASYTGDSPSGLTLTDVLPANYTIDTNAFALAQNGWSCSVSGQTVSCTRPSGGVAGTDQSLGSVSVPVTINTAGTVTNTATIGAASPSDPRPANNTATDGGTTLQDPTADLAVSKLGPSPALVVINEPFDFTLRVSNGGPSPFTGTVVLTDSVPAGLTVNSYGLNGWACLPAAPVVGPAEIECRRDYTPGSDLAAGASAPAVTLNTTATVTGPVTNEAFVSTLGANVPDPNPANDATSRGVTSYVPGDAADIRVLKSADLATVPAGEVLTYTLELVNDGPVAAADVVLTDTLSTLVSGSGYVGHTIDYAGIPPAEFTCSYTAFNSTSGRFRCTVDDLPVCTVGSCPSVELQIRPGGNGGARANRAWVISNTTADDDLSNNRAEVSTTILARADVTVTKTATPDPVPAGQELVYVVTARNNGPSRADGVSFIDELPTDVFFVGTSPGSITCAGISPGTVTTAGNRTLACALGSLNNGAQRAVTIRVRPTSITRGTTLTNDVTVTTTTTEPSGPGATNNTASVTADVLNPALDLVANLSDTVDPVAVFDTTSYVATATNAGPSDAENVVLTLDLPIAGLRFLSASMSAGACSSTPVPGSLGGQVVCSVARLAAGTSVTLTVPMTGDTKGVYGATLSIESDETPTFEDPSNNVATENTTVRTRADVEVASKVASSATVAVRRPFSWTILVRNNTGPTLTEADTVVVSDALPSGMELTGAPTVLVTAGSASASSCTGTAGATSFACDLGTLSSGGVVEITVPVRALTVPAGGIRTNTATVTTSSRDLVPGNNSNSGSVTVAGSSLSGRVFRDFADDGGVDPGDTGIGGVTITLTGTAFDGSSVSRTATTGADGSWTISGLPEGTYRIARGTVSEAHLVDGRQTTGDRGGDASAPLAISSIALGEIDAGTGYLFALVPRARIGLAKRVTAGPTVAPDSSYAATVQLVVRNYSLEALDGVALTDPLAGAAPSFGTFVAGGGAAVLSPGDYTIETAPAFVGACAGGVPNAAFDGDGTTELGTITSLASGASCTLAFTLRFQPVVPLPPGGYTNQARVDATGALSGQSVFDLSHDGADPDPSGDGDPGPESTPTPLTPTLVADVTTDVVFPASVDAGEPVAGTVLFRNAGPYAATGVGYTLTLTPGLSGVSFTNLPVGATASYAPGTGAVTFTGMPTTLQADQIASGDGTGPIGVTYTQNGAASTSVASGISTATSQGANALPDTDTAPVAGGLIADVTTAVSFPSLVNPGGAVSGTVLFRNDGPSAASGMTYTLQLTAGLTGVTFGNLPAGATATYDPGSGTVTLAGMPTSLTPGQIASGDGVGGITVDYVQPPSATSQVDSGTSTSTNQGANAAPDSDSALVVGDATVGVAKQGSVAGDTVTYDLKLVNTGNAPADSITLAEDLDAVFGAGNYRLVEPPLVQLAPSAGAIALDPAFTGSAPSVHLLGTSDPTANRLPPGDSAVVRLRVEVTRATDRGFGPGVYQNQAVATSRGPGGTGFTDRSTDGPAVDPDGNGDPTDDDVPTVVSIPPHAEIGVAKRAFVEGRRVTFDFTLVNTGNVDARTVRLVDDLDPVFGAGNYAVVGAPTFVVDPGTLRLDPGYTGSGAGTEITDRGFVDTNALALGDSAVVRVQVEILTLSDQGLGLGRYRNRASTLASTEFGGDPIRDESVDGSDVDPDGNGDPTDDTSPTPVQIPLADLLVEKSGPASAMVGDTLTFTLAVTNSGPAPANDVILRDSLPAGFRFVAASNGGTNAGPLVRWAAVASLAPGARFERTVTVVATDAGSWLNVASATSPTVDPNPSDNDGSDPRNRTTTTVTDVPGPTLADLRVTKSGPASAAVGDTVIYLIATANLGPAAALEVVVFDDLPAGAEFVSSSRGATLSGTALRWPTLALLAAGASIVDTVRVRLPEAGTYRNVARGSSDTTDPDPSNNDGSRDDARVDTEVGGIDLAVSKTLTSDLVAGALATYELRVANAGSRATTGPVELVDDLPSGLTFVSAEGSGWSCALQGDRVVCSSDDVLEPGVSLSVTLTVRVTATAGESIVNGVRVSTDGENPDDDNRDETDPEEVLPPGVLEIEKSVDRDAAGIGDVLRYRVVVRNRGSGPLTDVELEDHLPAGFRLVEGSVLRDERSAPDPEGAPGPLLRFPVGDLAGGAAVEWSYALQVGVGADLGDGVNRAFARSAAGSAMSDTARAAVAIRRGIFDDEGLIVGRVWIQRSDSTSDSILGVPGVRVYLNDGTSAITDVDGRYSFQGLRPRNWVVRVDERTLPAEMELDRLTTRHGGEGSNRLVDLTRGEMARADFGDTAADLDLWRAVEARVARGPVLEVAVPGRSALWAGTSLVPVTGSAGAPAFRRPGSTSGMLLDPAAEAWGGHAAAVGPRPESSGLGGTDELLVTGWVEARLDLRSLADGDLLASGVRDRFRDALEEIANTNDDGTIRIGARAAAFATGRLDERTRLTVRFDTERTEGRRFFADLRPDELYDVLGDASSTLFEAQSKGRLFAAVARDRSYLMLGDFATATYDEARQLGRYNRTLNGVLHHLETDRAVLRAFASRDRAQLVVDEIPALGVSGPYRLSRPDGLLNSERVEILTRDRNQPGVILTVEPLQRFTDYTVEPFTGRLVFRRPVASFDDAQNPVSIRVTYEAETGGERYWVFGADGRVGVTERLTLGGGVVRDDMPDARYELMSGDVGLRLGEANWVRAEVARSDSAGSRNGTGLRLEAGRSGAGLDLRAHWVRVDSTFSNPSAGLAAGRTEMGLRGLASLGERTSLEAEALRSTDDRLDRSLSGARLALGRDLSDRWRAGVSWRWASADSGATVVPEIGEVEVNALGVRLESRLGERTSAFTEFEQDLSDGDARRLEIGADVRVMDRTRLYARHELLSSLSGPYTLGSNRDRNATLVGVSSEYREGQSVFSEYRVGNGLSGRGAHAAIGLRNGWQIRDGLRLHTTLERVRPLTDGGEGDAFSITGAVEAATSPLWKGTLRGEFRSTDLSDHLFATAGYARRLSAHWTFLGQSAVSRTLDGGPFYERTRLGLAYRSGGRASWNALARYEHHTDEDLAASDGPVDRRAHVVSTHANVRWTDALVTRAQWAMKHTTDRSTGGTVEQTAHLLSARATLDVTRRFDAGVIGRTHFGDGRRFGLGLEAGLAISDDLRLSGGYNVFGFRDDELALEDVTDRGFFFGLGWRFDEGIFGMGRVGR